MSSGKGLGVDVFDHLRQELSAVQEKDSAAASEGQQAAVSSANEASASASTNILPPTGPPKADLFLTLGLSFYFPH